MRLLARVVLLAAAVLVPFALCGDEFNGWLGGDAVAWLRGFGRVGPFVVIALLIGDLFLPIPGTLVMSAAGYLYGPIAGGVVSAAGSFLSGILAYFLCRCFGRGMAVRLAGQTELIRGERLFDRHGGLLVALSRWIPVLPEVVACLAGLVRMPPQRFVLALACGSLPMGFAYAAIGATGRNRPALALALSAILPVILWVAAQAWLRPRKSP